MRINDLLEGKDFNDLKFVKANGDKREIDYDLAEDLFHFMNQDDDVYRRHLHPAIMKCQDRMDMKLPVKPEIFKPAITSSYELYTKKFPIRELPISLDEKMCAEMCSKMHEEVCQHIKDGKYKE
jgi:hypothetical protein